MLVELLIAMTFLAIAIGALLTVFASSLVSLRHASIEGNALTLADKQMESFRTLPMAGIKLDASTIPSGDPYASAPPPNLTTAQQWAISGGQETGGTIPAVQTVTGPDDRTYRVDSYVFTAGVVDGRPVLEVTVAVRQVVDGVPSDIKAHTTSAIDVATTQDAPD